MARAAAKLGEHARAAEAWSKAGHDKTLAPLVRREHALALARAGRADDAMRLAGKVSSASSDSQLALVAELGLLLDDRKILLLAGGVRPRDPTRNWPAELAVRFHLAHGAEKQAAEHAVRLAREGTHALDAEPLSLVKPAPVLGHADRAVRWKNAQLRGHGEMAAAECAAWAATIPTETTPDLDDALFACGRLLSLTRHAAANTVLLRATAVPKHANAAWLAVARLRARGDDLDAIDDACSHVAPKSLEAAECFALTAVLRLRAGHLDVARARLHALDTQFPNSAKRREAWMQFVAHRWDDPDVPSVLESLLKSARDPVAKAEASYWLGRKSTDPATARKHWEISLAADPLGYWGALANARLGGATAAARTPGRTKPADATLALLRRAGFFDEAERRALAKRSSRNTKQVVNQMAVLGEGGAWETIVRAGILGGGETKWPVQPLTRATFPVAFPDELSNVPESRRALLLSLMRRESLFDPDAISFVGARGLLQLMPKTATRLSTDAALPVPEMDDLHVPALNVDLADRYVALLLERFTHPLVAAAAYNAGPPSVLKWIDEAKSRDLDLWVERIPFRETRLYVKAVGAALAGYTRVETGTFPSVALEVPTPATTGVDY